jgi:hypothetical protein
MNRDDAPSEQDRDQAARCLHQTMKGKGMRFFLSEEQLDASVAHLRAVKPDLAPLDTPLAERPLVVSVRSDGETADFKRIVALLKRWHYRVNTADMRLADEPDAEASTTDGTEEDIQPHILHYVGHGSYRRSCSVPALNDIDQVLVYHTVRLPLSLVVLDACLSAAAEEPSPAAAEKPSSSTLARAFIDKGVPAVVAMQYPVSPATCTRMFEAFYSSLARGKTVRAAAYASRKAVQEEDVSCEPLTLYERTVHGCRKAAFPRKRPAGAE